MNTAPPPRFACASRSRYGSWQRRWLWGWPSGFLRSFCAACKVTPSIPRSTAYVSSSCSVSAQLDLGLDQEVERARLSLDTEPVALAGVRQRFESAQQGLRQAFAGLENDRNIAVALQAYALAAQQKARLAREVDGQLHAFVESFARMRKQSEVTLVSLQAAGDAATRRTAMALVSAVTSYSIQATPTNAVELDDLLGKLAAAPAEPDKRAATSQLAATVAKLRADKDGLQDRLRQLHAIPTAASLRQLHDAYLDFSQAQDAARERARLILAVYASALLIAFGVLGLRLRKSFGDLDQANAELQRANESLEQRIAERTRELSKALEDLRTQQAQLIQSEKMASLGQMVAGVAHEINTPLGYARGNVETVRELMGGIVQRDAQLETELGEAGVLLEDAEYGLVRIAELVQTLKDFSRVDRSRTELFNVNDCLEAALKICHNQIKDRIEVRRDYGELPRIPCAPSQLNQVFLNLISNAAQAIDGPGTITVATRAADEQVEIRVRDSGCGMEPDIRAHIFEPFFTTKPIGKGTGLGLSIAYRIIEDHHGTIMVQSAPGEGAEFTIVLPLRPPRNPARADATIGSATAGMTP